LYDYGLVNTGNVLTNVIAKPSVTIGFVGVELTVNPEYENSDGNAKSRSRNAKKAGTPKSRKAKIGDLVILLHLVRELLLMLRLMRVFLVE
jgi:hypothetical protein